EARRDPASGLRALGGDRIRPLSAGLGAAGAQPRAHGAPARSASPGARSKEKALELDRRFRDAGKARPAAAGPPTEAGLPTKHAQQPLARPAAAGPAAEAGQLTRHVQQQPLGQPGPDLGCSATPPPGSEERRGSSGHTGDAGVVRLSSPIGNARRLPELYGVSE
ncbi:unnamed protein product, partial [Prorocentrum cordatum]